VRRNQWTGRFVGRIGTAALIGLSAGQTFSRYREADDEAFWLPVPGDFASIPAIVVRTIAEPARA
jgi:hypothetical protein